MEKLNLASPVISAVAADSQIVGYLAIDGRLFTQGMNALERATLVGHVIHVSSVCLVEVIYLSGDEERN